MIIKFAVENFKSINERVELNMVSSSVKEHNEVLLKDMFLPSASIYGANASGKSNFLQALSYFKSIIQINNPASKTIPFKPFFGKEHKPSHFEILFIYDGQRYYYGFKVNKYQVLEEYLYKYPNNKEAKIFHRKINKLIAPKNNKEIDTLFGRVSNSVFFINTAAKWNYKEIAKPYEYLANKLVTQLKPELHPSWMNFTAKKINENPEYKSQVLELFKNLDFSILNIDIEKVENTKKDLEKLLPVELSDLILNKMEDSDTSISYKVYFIYKTDKKEIRIPYSSESLGTRRLFNMLGPMIDILTKGKILIWDELESSIHPVIIKKIISLFHSKELNKRNAQLIFSTHNTNLLDLDFFRRDQIWFTEMNDNRETELYSLYDLKGVRKKENIRNGYLKGKYGAIPCLNRNLTKDFKNE